MTSSKQTVIKEPIIKLIAFEELSKVLIIGETSIRVFCVVDNKTVGGGSIKNRLEKGRVVDASFCATASVLCLGATCQTLALFKLNKETLAVDFIHSRYHHAPILACAFSLTSMVVLTAEDLRIFSVSNQNDNVDCLLSSHLVAKSAPNLVGNLDPKFTCFHIDMLNGGIILGDSKGRVWFYDQKTGVVLSCIQAHVDSVSQLGFLEGQNCVVTTSAWEVKIWRIGASSSLSLLAQKK